MMRTLNCLRCDCEMQFLKREKIQLGQTGFVFGDWPNLLAGSLETEIFCCPHCGKLEFYMPDLPAPEFDEPELENDELPPDADRNIVDVSMEGIPQVLCPVCGIRHDFDYPKCPRCNHMY